MKIKNILAFFTLGMVSCVGLEQYPTNSYTDKTYWQYEENVRAALYLGYNQVWNDNDHQYYFANNTLSDDTYGSRHSQAEFDIVTGMANAKNGRFSGEWNVCYQALRTLHTFLDADAAGSITIDEKIKERMVAEVRLMRAFVYLRLVTWYGNVPFFTTNPTLQEARVVAPTPATEIKKFIHEELEYAASILPKNTEIPAEENGRYTCGTAIAIKARAYLLDNDFENCAIECAKLINTTDYGTYGLEPDYKKLFHDQASYYGPEAIMTVEYAALNGIESIVRGWNSSAWLPGSLGNSGVQTWSPTQELVNTFRKLDGSVAGDTDYAGRDLRFDATIVYNGATVEIPEGRGLALVGTGGAGKGTYKAYTKESDETALKDPNRFDSYNGSQDRTATGYYGIKNYNASMIDKGGSTYLSIFEIRFADILLMYAESMNETSQMSSTIWDQTIKPLRERAGFDAVYCAYPSGDVRQAIRDERRVELALEGRRTFDIRRWAALADPSLKTAGGVYLMSQPTGAPFRSDNSTIVCPNRYGMKYWFAIPQGERDINKNLPQNPGW